MKTFQRYLSSINEGSIVEVLDLPAAVLDHLLAKFLRYRKTDGDDYEPDTLPGLQRSIQRLLSEGRSPFTVLLPFKRQLVRPEQYSSQHQQILLCNKSQFKHLQGPSDSDLSGSLSKSGPLHFGSGNSFPSNFSQ